MIKTEGELIAPDMTGWSLRDVMKVAKVANMKLNSVGNGFVVKQNYKPGSKMFEGEYLIVDLDKPSSSKVRIVNQLKVKQKMKTQTKKVIMKIRVKRK